MPPRRATRSADQAQEASAGRQQTDDNVTAQPRLPLEPHDDTSKAFTLVETLPLSLQRQLTRLEAVVATMRESSAAKVTSAEGLVAAARDQLVLLQRRLSERGDAPADTRPAGSLHQLHSDGATTASAESDDPLLLRTRNIELQQHIFSLQREVLRQSRLLQTTAIAYSPMYMFGAAQGLIMGAAQGRLPAPQHLPEPPAAAAPAPAATPSRVSHWVNLTDSSGVLGGRKRRRTQAAAQPHVAPPAARDAVRPPESREGGPQVATATSMAASTTVAPIVFHYQNAAGAQPAQSARGDEVSSRVRTKPLKYHLYEGKP